MVEKQRIHCEILPLVMQNIINHKCEMGYGYSDQAQGAAFLARTGNQNPAENK